MGEPVLLLTAGHRALEKVQVTGGDETDEKHVVVVDSPDFDVFVGVKEPCELFAAVNVDDGIRGSVRNEQWTAFDASWGTAPPISRSTGF
jgi:hypothetical protein